MISTSAFDANVQKEQFILDRQAMVAFEAAKVARACRNLSREDLYGEGMLYLCEHADDMLAYECPESLARYAVRLHLRRYSVRYDSLIKTPMPHDRPRQHPIKWAASLDVPVGEGDSSAVLADLVAAPVDEDALLDVWLRQALEKLSDFEQRALAARLQSAGSQPFTSYRKICVELGMSQRQAKRLVEGILERLRREVVAC